MKHLLRLGCVLFLSSGLLAAPSAPATGFDQLKSLAGTWEDSASPSGNIIHVSYELVSNGTALLERLNLGSEPEMISVYTADGPRVAMTHYCGANNQPQMQTEPIPGPAKRITFSFVRATNLASPDLGHMDPKADGDSREPRANLEPVYFAVSDLEAAYKRAETVGGLLNEVGDGDLPMGRIAERPWAERSFYLRDPSGNPLCFVDDKTLFTGHPRRAEE